MKVKLTVSRGGSHPQTVKQKNSSGKEITLHIPNSITQEPGEIIEVSDAEGQRLIDSGQAEPVSKPRAERRKAADPDG